MLKLFKEAKILMIHKLQEADLQYYYLQVHFYRIISLLVLSTFNYIA